MRYVPTTKRWQGSVDGGRGGWIQSVETTALRFRREYDRRLAERFGCDHAAAKGWQMAEVLTELLDPNYWLAFSQVEVGTAGTSQEGVKDESS